MSKEIETKEDQKMGIKFWRSSRFWMTIRMKHLKSKTEKQNITFFYKKIIISRQVHLSLRSIMILFASLVILGNTILFPVSRYIS